MKNNKLKWLAIGTLATAASYRGLKHWHKKQTEQRQQVSRSEVGTRDYGERHVYFIGGGLASLAGAAYLIRDANFAGANIHVLEGLDILGGSDDGSGNVEAGFLCRGGRMLNEETFENFWELFDSIPSLEMPNQSVTEEILNFDHLHPTHAQARLVDRDGTILDTHTMGFDTNDRLKMSRLLSTSETTLDNLRILDWFDDHFFETNFWYMWQTTFAFQKWSSLFEFRRYMNRMILEFSRIDTLAGVTRSRYNQYESLIMPLQSFLEKHQVDFQTNTVVTDIDFADSQGVTVQNYIWLVAKPSLFEKKML